MLVENMKCQQHGKHYVLWWDPCVKKRVPNYWKRLDRVAWLIGLEASIISLGRIQIQQTKEKFGSIRVYYSCYKSVDKVNEGYCQTYDNGKDITIPHTVPKYLWKAMERQRRLNPDLAHNIYDFAPYECNCKDAFWCKKYENVNPIQKLWDKIVTRILIFYGNHSSRWRMLSGGFVLFGNQWGYDFWMKVRRTLRRPL